MGEKKSDCQERTERMHRFVKQKQDEVLRPGVVDDRYERVQGIENPFSGNIP